MVKYWLFVLFFFGWTQIHVSAQNLVQNPGFEEFTNCPSSLNNFNDVRPWCSPTAGSPDYFNLCGNYYYKSRSYPFEGKGYAGLILFSDNETVNEYMQIQLDEPLFPGVEYHFQAAFKIDEQSPFVTNKITIGFQKQNRFYDYWAEVKPTEYFTITLENPFQWQLIDTIFTVTDTLQSLLFGNFIPLKNLPKTFNESGKKIPGWACYLYLDALTVAPAEASPAQQNSEREATLGSTRKIESYTAYFNTNQAELTAEELNRMLTFFKSLKVDAIEIIGHTDSDGTALYNNNLSALRAEYVLQLIQTNFPEIQLKNGHSKLEFKGETEPVNENKTPEEKALNRRVEINLINFRTN